MRVALVCDWFLPRLGGIEFHLRDLALAFRAHGIEATIVTTTPGDDSIGGVPVCRIAGLRLPGTGVVLDPRAHRRIREVVQGGAFDVVHAHASVISPAAYGAALAASSAGIPTVVTFHSMLLRSAAVLGGLEAVGGWSRNVALTTVSSVVAEQLARYMPGADIGILPNGIDARFWRAASRPRTDGRVHFVSAIRLTRKKRPERLVRAFAKAVQFVGGSPDIHLTIAGSGAESGALRSLANGLGIGDRVSLPGMSSREELRALYSTADGFVLPSELESFGIAALEARAAGLPVIAMAGSGVRDFIVPWKNGLLASDEAALGNLMERFAASPPLRRQLASASLPVVAMHDWGSAVADHVRVYQLAGATRRADDANSHPQPGTASATK